MDALRSICRTIKQSEHTLSYLIPFDWIPHEDGTIFPLPAAHAWSSLEMLGEELGVTAGILCTFPLIWQLEPLAHKAARALSVPIAVTSPQNLPLSLPYVNEAGIDIVITAPEHLLQLSAILEKASCYPKAITVVHKDLSMIDRAHSDILTVHELHLVPGFVLAYQTAQLAKQNMTEQKFKLGDACIWHVREDGEAVISSHKSSIVQFHDLPLPYRFIKDAKDDSYAIQAI